MPADRRSDAMKSFMAANRAGGGKRQGRCPCSGALENRLRQVPAPEANGVEMRTQPARRPVGERPILAADAPNLDAARLRRRVQLGNVGDAGHAHAAAEGDLSRLPGLQRLVDSDPVRHAVIVRDRSPKLKDSTRAAIPMMAT